MKRRTGSSLSRTKYIKCFRVETSCYGLVLWLNFNVTVELLYDQAESDFVQCQTKMRAFASRICSEFKQIELNWNRIVHQNTLWSLVFSTTRPWNKQISAPDASQPSSQERWQEKESGLFQYILYACTIACLSFIPLYKQRLYKCYSLPPS